MNNGFDEFDSETIEQVEKMFMEMEGDYVLKLLQIREFEEFVTKFYAYSNIALMHRFIELQERMDNGEVTEEDEEKVELEMIACVLAMAEKVKVRILSKTSTFKEEEKSHGRSH